MQLLMLAREVQIWHLSESYASKVEMPSNKRQVTMDGSREGAYDYYSNELGQIQREGKGRGSFGG